VRAVVPRMAVAFLARIGAPVERILARVGLTPRSIDDPESLVPFLAVAELLEEAARTQGIEDLGLRLGACSRVEQLGTFGREIARAFTLQEALETAYRLFPSFSSGGHAWCSRERNAIRLHDRFVIDDPDGWPQAVGLSLMLHLNLVRAAAGSGWGPTEVRVPAPVVPCCRTMPMLADARLVFGNRGITIAFEGSVLSRRLPCRAASPPQDASRWEAARPAMDVNGAVQQVVTTLLPEGYPDVHLVAEAMRMSPRTLQRRLQGEGITFARVVARARFDVALRLLDDPDCKLIDVALDLGYSDPAHFTRAFVRWTGVAPREFRRQRSAGQAHPAAP